MDFVEIACGLIHGGDEAGAPINLEQKIMLPIHQIENFLKFAPPQLQEIALELRNIIFSVAPDAAEVVPWGDLSYFHAGRGGIISAGICQIEIRKESCPPGVYPWGVFHPIRINFCVVHKKPNDLLRSIPMTTLRGMI